MKYLMLIITTVLLAACGSKTYIQQRPVVVEKPVYTNTPVVVERERVIER